FAGVSQQIGTFAAGQVSLNQHVRVRLTSIPNLATHLRVLGKTSCPVLTDYDVMPINNVEPGLMAFARGDMLMRSRQHGKASIAQQEGATLLAQLTRSEAYQTANRFQVQPDNGFGGHLGLAPGNSYRPL
ncbi:MAG TPA: hypothetical protein VF607_03585, partial [Verrucomicrobiae bacterium]